LLAPWHIVKSFRDVMLVQIPQLWKFQGYSKSLKFFDIGKGGEIITTINVIEAKGST
jgi:hypothetical protein